MKKGEVIYSRHHFMFPFRWDILKKGFNPLNERKEEKYSFEERTQLNKVPAFLVEESRWKREEFKIKETKDYNELTYFHEFVRQTIYDFDENAAGETLMNYFEYQLKYFGDTCNYVIKYYEKKEKLPDDFDYNNSINYNEKQFSLLIKGISLHIYNTGIGVLTYNLVNICPDQSTPDDILKINEFGRRTYPQFLGKKSSFDTKRVFLASEIVVGNLTPEKFDNYAELGDICVKNTFFPPSFIKELFSNKVIFNEGNILDEDKILFTKVFDDRMFFLCWYGNKIFSEEIKKCYKDCGWLYSFICGDKIPGSGIQNDDMLRKFLTEHTYRRWSDYGIFFGMSRDSFVCISADIDYFDKNGFPPLDIHMDTIYYQIAILSLVQRATVVKFTAEIASLTDMAKVEHTGKALDWIKDLYRNYIEFINKIYFREVTSQIQGIEIYQQLHSVMKIDDDVKDLDREMQELHSYAEMVKQYSLARRADKIGFWGAGLVIASLVAGILGINFFGEKPVLFHGHMPPEVSYALLIIFGIPGITLLVWKALENLKIKK